MEHKDIKLPSNLTFGLFFAGVFAAFGLYKYVYGGALIASLSGFASLGFLAVTFIARDLLTPLNRLWMRFGLLLSAIVGPIVLGILFFGLFTPVAVATRLFGRDELKLKKTQADSHWRTRDPAGPEPESFANQF